jgi:hypothetical protein
MSIQTKKALTALAKAGDLVGCFKDTPADWSSNPAYMEQFGRPTDSLRHMQVQERTPQVQTKLPAVGTTIFTVNVGARR